MPVARRLCGHGVKLTAGCGCTSTPPYVFMALSITYNKNSLPFTLVSYVLDVKSTHNVSSPTRTDGFQLNLCRSYAKTIVVFCSHLMEHNSDFVSRSDLNLLNFSKAINETCSRAM